MLFLGQHKAGDTNGFKPIQHKTMATDEGDTMQPLKPCKHPGCRNLSTNGYCDLHKTERGPWASRNKPKRLRGRRSQDRRKRIAEKAGYKCSICGKVTVKGIADHIVPLAEGGEDTEENMQWLGHECHEAKTKRESKRGKR